MENMKDKTIYNFDGKRHDLSYLIQNDLSGKQIDVLIDLLSGAYNSKGALLSYIYGGGAPDVSVPVELTKTFKDMFVDGQSPAVVIDTDKRGLVCVEKMFLHKLLSDLQV